MKILLIGTGMQGRAALADLVADSAVDEIVAADRDVDGLREHVRSRGYGAQVTVRRVDGASAESVTRLVGDERPRVIVDLLPVPLHGAVTQAAVEHGVHLVTASYADEEMQRLAGEAAARGVALLPECGMDPGIDLILLADAVGWLDEVRTIRSYGAGFPEEAAAAANPLRYKVTWSFEGVLRSYLRSAKVIRRGALVEIDAREIFAPQNIHEVEIEGVGRLEAFANGDAAQYAAHLGLDPNLLQGMERCVLRWPGHAALWKTFVDLHLLDDEPVHIEGRPVDRKSFLAAALAPYLRYGPGERDVVVVRVEASGTRAGKPCRALRQVVDRRDLATGRSAMSRTVGFTASICAAMIAHGTIASRGLLSPLRHVPYGLFVEQLGARGIEVRSWADGGEDDDGSCAREKVNVAP